MLLPLSFISVSVSNETLIDLGSLLCGSGWFPSELSPWQFTFFFLFLFIHLSYLFTLIYVYDSVHFCIFLARLCELYAVRNFQLDPHFISTRFYHYLYIFYIFSPMYPHITIVDLYEANWKTHFFLHLPISMTTIQLLLKRKIHYIILCASI